MIEFFKHYNLTPQQYSVLRIIHTVGDEGLPSLEIGRRLVERLPDITRLITRLEKAGWVYRERSTMDRRVVRVFLTAEGKRLAEELEEPINEFSSKCVSHMSSEELETLNRLLEKVRGD